MHQDAVAVRAWVALSATRFCRQRKRKGKRKTGCEKTKPAQGGLWNFFEPTF
jgi:hypothetical protein